MADESTPPPPAPPLHPIGVVARRTGISLHVLRAWERRYAVVTPVRTPGGQRLYTDADIQRLHLLREVTESGRSISQVAELSDEELAALAAEDVPRGVSPLEETVAWYRETCLSAGERMNGDLVHATLMRAVVALRPREFMDDVLLPLLHEVGARWHAGTIGPVHEHVVSQATRRVLHWLLGAYESVAHGPLLLTTTPEGELHEFGAMAVSAAALEEGWRVVYLGPSLPAEEIVRAARHLRASHVGLSVVDTSAGDEMLERIRLTAEGLPEGTSLLVGGAGGESLRKELESIGARVLTEMTAVREALRFERRLARGSA